MEQYYVPAFEGLNKDYSARIIPKTKVQDCKNVLFEKGRIKSRWGYTTLGANLPLNGEVMKFLYFEQLDPGNKHILCFTTRDGYKYNISTGNWDFITERYITGTAACSGTTAVTGTATAWDNTTWVPGGVWQIKFGTQNPNGTGTPDTWYNITSFSSTTALTLSSAGPTTGGAVNYVIRKCWTGDIDNGFSLTVPFFDGAEAGGTNEKVVVATNGVDIPKYWTGSNYFVELSTDGVKAKYVNYFGGVAFEHLILSNIVDGATNYPQRISTPDAGKILSWGTWRSEYDMQNTTDFITGLADLGGRIFIYKQSTITEMWADPSGDNEDPFNFTQNKIPDKGLPTINLLVNMGNSHIFLNEQNVWVFDGINVKDIGGEIMNSMLDEINKEKISHGFAYALPEKTIILFFIPTTESTLAVADRTYPYKCYIYNYIDNTWSVWIPSNQMTAMGIYKGKYAPTWAELKTAGTLWSAMKMRWVDLKRYDENYRYLMGDKDGYVYQFEKIFNTDNGAPLETQVVTKDYTLLEPDEPKKTKMILELVIGLHKIVDHNGLDITTTLSVECSVDGGSTWSTAQSQTETWATVTGDYVEKTFNFFQHGNKVRFRITSTTPHEYEAVNIGFNYLKGVKR